MKISQKVFNLQSGVHGGNGYVQCSKGNNSKCRQSDLMFMCSACCLLVLYICVKFRENITNGIRVLERTRARGRKGYVQCSKGNNFVSRQTRVTVYVFCTLSYDALHWCEVS